MYIPVTAARSPYHCCCPLSLLLPFVLAAVVLLLFKPIYKYTNIQKNQIYKITKQCRNTSCVFTSAVVCAVIKYKSFCVRNITYLMLTTMVKKFKQKSLLVVGQVIITNLL